MPIANSLIELIGNTPLLELRNYEREEGAAAKIVAKLEYFNPLSSVKDRIGAALIEDAEAKGLIDRDSVIIEPTSGNTCLLYTSGWKTDRADTSCEPGKIWL